MATPNATITKAIALAPDGWKRTAFPDGSVPNAGPSAPPEFTTSKTANSITATIINANGATSFAVSVDGTNFTSGLTAGGLTAEQTYPFSVKGINEFGEAVSNPVNITTSAAAAGQQTITGTGFGAGPNVVLFASMDGVSGELIGLTDSEVGVFDALLADAGVAGPRYLTKNGKTWMTGRDITQVSSSTKYFCGVTARAPIPYEKVRIAYKLARADGYRMPGSPTLTGKPSDSGGSVFKTAWLYNGADGHSIAGQADVCLPTWVGNCWVSGNTTTPEVAGSDVYLSTSAWDFDTGENLFSYYSGAIETAPGANDGVMSWLRATQGPLPNFTNERRTNADPFAETSSQPRATESKWDRINFPGWYGNYSFVDVMPLYRDLYFAVGDNSEACIILSNAATLAASSEFALIPPDSWTDTAITYTPRAYDPSFRHLILADGTVKENV